MVYSMIVADDHPIVRAGICSVIQAHGGYQIVGQANDGYELIQLLKLHQPDVILLDVRMPGMKVNKLVSYIQVNCSQCKIVVLSAYDDPGIVKSLIDQGVDGYILKDEMQEAVLDALQAILKEGKHWMSEGIQKRYDSATHHKPSTQLISEREWHVIELLKKGYSNQEIANELDITKSTVSYHVSNILGKLHLNSRLEIATWAIRHTTQ